MTAQELRKKFLDFFQSKGHTIIPSASLVPKETDPSVLFTTAGMHPLVPYLLGEDHPGGKRVANVQKCIRTGDIDEVGDASHLTFFEMLGNWSFGDYFKKEAIKWSWEFLTSPEWLGLDKNRFAVSIFAGDEDAPFDEEAFDLWKNIGIPEQKIARLPKKNNWWGPAGKTGPCGPDTEIFYWTGDTDKIPDSFNDDNDLWIEVWNNVFMQYDKNEAGTFVPLKQKNVDTGMGLERLAMIMEGKNNVYETDLFAPIIEEIKKISSTNHEPQTKNYRIIADHIKASVFIISDGIAPSNTGQGYVVRRLVRRSVRYGKLLGINKNFIIHLAAAVVEVYNDFYPELEQNKNRIFDELEKEENKFRLTLERGLKEFNEIDREVKKIKFIYENPFQNNLGLIEFQNITAVYLDIKPFKELFKYYNENLKDIISPIEPLNEKSNKILKDSPEIVNFIKSECDKILKNIIINGRTVFNLYQSYGFPIELTRELASEQGYKIDEEGFNNELKKHQELSRTSSVGMFKGGLVDAGEATAKLHTATHLLLAALREILGEEIYQKGSNITAERLRFDFNYPQKLTSEQIQKVEDLVNEKIRENLSVEMTEMPKDEALKITKVSFDASRYGDIVKVYKIGPSTSSGQAFSIEVCGGPHAKITGELGKFKITKEEASSAGIRRIKAILE